MAVQLQPGQPFREPFVPVQRDKRPSWLAELESLGYGINARIVDYLGDQKGRCTSIGSYLKSLLRDAAVTETVARRQEAHTCGHVAGAVARTLKAAGDDWQTVDVSGAVAERSWMDANKAIGKPEGEKWEFMEASELGVLLTQWAPQFAEVVSLDQAQLRIAVLLRYVAFRVGALEPSDGGSSADGVDEWKPAGQTELLHRQPTNPLVLIVSDDVSGHRGSHWFTVCVSVTSPRGKPLVGSGQANTRADRRRQRRVNKPLFPPRPDVTIN
jgi:hypothetical protein